MRRPVLFNILFATLLIAGVATVGLVFGWDGPDRDRTQTIRIVTGDGSALPPDSTIIVNADDGWRPGFPFGFFFFPFFLLFGIFLVTRLAWGGGRHGWNGRSGAGGPDGPPPGWFEQMHLRAHEAEWNKSSTPAPNDAG